MGKNVMTLALIVQSQHPAVVLEKHNLITFTQSTQSGHGVNSDLPTCV